MIVLQDKVERLGGANGQGKENNTEFSTEVINGDRMTVQAVSTRVKEPSTEGSVWRVK